MLNKQLMCYPHQQQVTKKVYALTSTIHIAGGQIPANIGTNVPFVQSATQSINVLKRCPHPTCIMGGSLFKKTISPVMWQKILPWLLSYPDRQKAHVLINGFKDGFILPTFLEQGCKLVSNLKSVDDMHEVVREKILKEIQEGRFEGHFSSPPFINFRISPLDIVPKKDPNSVRLIHHLSYPVGDSLNDQISEDMALVMYASFEDALVQLRRLGPGALLAKANIKSAFRLLPIHQDCFNSLGFFL